MSEITPSQTVGPFFAYGLTPKGRCEWDPNGSYSWKNTVESNLVTPDVSGTRIRIEGVRLSTATASRSTTAMIEIWQADAQGRYASPQDNRALPNTAVQGLRPFGDRQGRRLRLRHHQAGLGAGPGRQAAGAACRGLHLLARHAAAGLYAAVFLRRGRQRHRSDPDAGAGRPPRHADCPQAGGSEPALYRFDIRVQGDNETVFFEI